MTDVLKFNTVEEVPAPAKDGAIVIGLFMEGARWDDANVTVDKARPKEMFIKMPRMTVRGITLDKVETRGFYRAPCYMTQMRGPTFVFQATLKTKSPAARWVLAGVALIMDVV